MTDRFLRRSAIVLLLVGLAWLAAAIVLVVSGTSHLAGVDGGLGGIVAAVQLERLAPPLAVIVFGVVMFGRRGDSEALAVLEARTAAAGAASVAIRDGLLDIDATLAAIGGRLEALHTATTVETPRLVDTANAVVAAGKALTQSAAATTAAAHDLAGVVPAAQGHAATLDAMLAATGSETRRQIADVDSMLTGIHTQQRAVAAQVDDIAAATQAAAAAIDDRTATLAATVDAALSGAVTALDTVRTSVDAQARTMLASIDAARIGLDSVGGTAALTVKARVDHIVAATAALGEQLDGHDARTAAMIATIERSFTVLDKRLSHATAMGTATLDGFHARMTSVREVADAVAPRLDATRAGMVEVEAAAARLAPAATNAEALIAALATMTAPAIDLAARLTAARADLAAIEEAAHGSALAASTQLIEVLGRVREVAATAAGTLRATLADVVAEAESALADAGARTAASAFADPVRHEIAGLEGAAAMAGEAAQATADRIAARLLGLTAAVATVERRLAEVER